MKEFGESIGMDSRAAALRATALHRETERLSRQRSAVLRPFGSTETVFSNGWLVLADEVVWGSLRVRNGEIVSLDRGTSRVAGALDLGGDFLLPGLVDLHTDNLERHLQPRPGVAWPTAAALLAHDRQMAAAGVTTVFDSLCVGDQFEGRTGREDALAGAIAALEVAQRDDLLACDHLLHLRCEVSSLGTVAAFSTYAGHPLVRMASLMDHTPGQRQWRRLDRWRQVNGERISSDVDLDDVLAQRQAQQQEYAPRARCQVAALARAQGLALASHDDTTDEHVEEAAADGVTICEFPTTAVAAAAARRRRLAIIMGAPNVVLGGSHSGNVSARELAAVGLVDGLASDYVPASLLQSCFALHDGHGLPLADAVAMVTRNPAAMVGLDDRGEIAVGKRADLIWVRRHRKMPVVRGSWCRGRSSL
jgi:phosphonate metabolism protein PhnM